MKCEGMVTKVDPYFGYFEIDNKFTIHLALRKAYREKTKLPVLHSRIKVKNVHKSPSIFVACKTSILSGEFSVNYTSNFITDFIKQHKLGAGDLIIIDKILKFLEKNYIFENNEIQKLVSESLFKKLINDQRKEPYAEQPCLNNILSHVDVVSISSCKYVEIQSEKFVEFPTWSFGVHSKQKNNTVLFGFIFIHSQYGFLMIQDALYKMICIVTNKETDIDQFENCYVIINRYTIITEVFKDSKVQNLEYLIVDSKDIIVVHALKKNILFGKFPPSEAFQYKKEFILYRKSTISLKGNNKTETYLEILLNKDEDQNWEKVFLILPYDYTTIIWHLKEGFKYNLYHSCPLTKPINGLLASLEKLVQFELEDKQAYFEEIGKAGDPDINKIIPVAELKEHISNNSGLFSFEGVILSKTFAKNFYDKSNNRIPYAFTTPGSENHVISFSHDTNDANAIFLSNWLNRLMPVGLIPEMRVIVKHTLHKSKYIKPTVFTSFEIVAYEPQVPFQTANLFENSEYDWGPRFYFSRGNKIPHGVIVWSKVQNIKIHEVEMANRCKKCGVIIDATGRCLECGGNDTNMKFELIMYTSDEFGFSRVIVNNVHFLRLLLDIQEQQFSLWLEAFERVGDYNFSIYKPDSGMYEPLIDDPDIFRHVLTKLIKTFNATLNDNFEIKCRKKFVDRKKIDYSRCPQWFYLDGRRCSY